jgi:hypothetical protein
MLLAQLTRTTIPFCSKAYKLLLSDLKGLMDVRRNEEEDESIDDSDVSLKPLL